jgi:hypothetical protein
MRKCICIKCGQSVTGQTKFCGNCGAQIPAASASSSAPVGQVRAEGTPADWEDEVCYDALIQRPEIREMLVRQAALAPEQMSGEDFLASMDKLFELAVPIGAVTQIAIQLTEPLSVWLGIHTGKVRKQHLALLPGRVIVNLLGALARHGQKLATVKQERDGCTIEAMEPSDLWSFEGSLFVTVRRAQQGTDVKAAVVIKGQLSTGARAAGCSIDSQRISRNSPPEHCAVQCSLSS